VPTVAEAGVPGYDFVAEIGLYAPAGTAQEIVAKLAGEVQKAVKSTDVAQRFKQLGIDPVGSTPDAYNAMNRASYQKYEKVVKASGAKID
jgi:tripartite-type tricarboxylate transporter receptor subunit TctC